MKVNKRQVLITAAAAGSFTAASRLLPISNDVARAAVAGAVSAIVAGAVSRKL